MEKKITRNHNTGCIRNNRPEHQESEKVSRMKPTQQLGSVLREGGERVLRSNIPHPPVSTTIENNKKTKDDKPIQYMGIVFDFANLKILISQLDHGRQQELLDYILLLRQEQKPTSDQERKLSMWCDSLNTELGNILGQTQRVFPQVFTTQAKKLLKDVTDFMLVNELDKLKTEEVKMMYNLLAKILVNHASIISARARIPLSMKLVLQTTTPVVSLFDNHFPGYVKAKLIKQILLAGRSGITHDDEDD